MSEVALTILIFLAWAVALAAVALFGLKLIHRFRRDSEFRKRQRYVDMVGDLIVREEYQHRSFRSRAADPLFRSVVLEYLRMMRGDERTSLLATARDMGMVARYTKELRHKDKQVRVAAAHALGEIADPSTLEGLVFSLTDPVSEVRAQAAAALSAIRDPRAVKSLLASMDHQDQGNAQRLADSLYAFGKDAVPEMTRYLHGPGLYRPLIARTLGLIGDLRAEPALLHAISSSSVELRLRAVAALGRAGSSEAAPYLVAALDDEQWEVRAQAATAIGRRRFREGLGALRRSLADPSWWVRHNAAAALAELPGGDETLRRALGHPDPYARDAAASMLLSMGAASDAARNVSSDDPLKRAASEELIGALIEAGKAEYFVSEGMAPSEVEAIHIRRQVMEAVNVASDR